MKNRNYTQRSFSPCFALLGLITFAILLNVCCGLTAASARKLVVVKKHADSPIVVKCKADLASRLKLQVKNISVVETQAVNWPDSALGMPENGKMYMQMLTTGSRVILNARYSQYLYTTGMDTFKYGGPVSLWSLSMLYSVPIQNEPNLNGDLYQCSLLGTNSRRLFSGVSDYYPQDNGGVIVKRRSSRSHHELLYLKAGDKAKAMMLHSAFDVGEAAINGAQEKWAGFVRPMMGAAWSIAVAGIGGSAADTQTLPLPDGVSPGRIAWSGDMIMILSSKDDQKICFEISPNAAKPEWKRVAAHLFPGLTSFSLNKSEVLSIDQVTENGKPCVEVSRLWFTGDRDLVARISDIELLGYAFHEGRYAFIWGKRADVSASYTIDIATGEIIPGYKGNSQNIKLFKCPPPRSPIVAAKSK